MPAPNGSIPGPAQIGPLGAVLVYAEDGQLMMEAAGQPPATLRAQGDHAFIPSIADTIRLTFNLTDGRASSVTLKMGDTKIRGERSP